MSEPLNTITLLLFATMRALIGKRVIILEIPTQSRVGDLRTLLSERYPDAALAIKATLFSVNREFATDEVLIPGGAEVAVFPHVSGG
ncbi:MAG: MoaD/ThiS family protein [Chloroflexi bacterium]|nr:MoaD/ThiS family protein [Chloroflexota bacterium]